MAEIALLKKLMQYGQINFLLTNRIPRRYITLFMGWFSQLEHPFIRKLSLRIWQYFADDLDLSEAKKTVFTSLHDCFIRELKPGARSIDLDAEVVVSPCDAIVGAHGTINGISLLQTKGFSYTLKDLLGDNDLVARYRDGYYMTLRLKSTMYHRFHAPYDCHIKGVNYISGDTWNVNPVSLKRIEKLYCKNERAVIDLQLKRSGCYLTLVPVAAILVAGIKLHCLPEVLDLRYKGPNYLPAYATFLKGDEMGYFQHGSTIIVFSNQRFRIVDNIQEGDRIQMGQHLFSFHQ